MQMSEAAPIGKRADEVRKTRRHERGATVNTGLRLAVNTAALDKKNYVHRFVNDEPGRIEALTKGGEWDIVQDPNKTIKSDATGEGTSVSVVVGTNAGGQPKRAVLLQKPKWIHDEDQKAKMADLDTTMSAIKRGKPKTADAEITGDTGYVPDGGISIR
jgi:hypothetical protein